MEAKQNHSSVLYYSLAVPSNDILQIVYKTLLCSSTTDTKGLFVKTENDFSPYFQDELSEDDKNVILKTYEKNIASLKESSIFLVYDNVFYQVNDKFHVTTLYTGGKIMEQSEEMEQQVGKSVDITLQKLAVCKNFVVIGIHDDFKSPYYGNPVRHITVALSKSGNKRVLPKDSFTALSDGTVYDLDISLSVSASKFSR